MIADSFDDRTLANLEVALERACRFLPAAENAHENWRSIANELLRHARKGETSLGRLTEIGEAAAKRMSYREPHAS